MQAAVLPAFARRRHARLAKERLLGLGLRIRIFHRHALRPERLQGFTHGFDTVFRTQQVQLKHKRKTR